MHDSQPAQWGERVRGWCERVRGWCERVRGWCEMGRERWCERGAIIGHGSYAQGWQGQLDTYTKCRMSVEFWLKITNLNLVFGHDWCTRRAAFR
jgi:hypothetical protein